MLTTTNCGPCGRWGRACTVMAFLLLAACSGGEIPEELATARVDLARVQPELTRFGGDERLGLVRAISAERDTEEVVVFGTAVCRFSGGTAASSCRTPAIPFEDVYGLKGLDGRVTGAIVSGGMGKPSAARVSTTGAVEWQFEGGERNMGSLAVADLTGGRAVLVSGADSIAVLDYLTGAVRSRLKGGRVLHGADWIGDAGQEYLFSPDPRTYELRSGDHRSRGSVILAEGSWPEPVMTPVTAVGERPYLVSSAGRVLSVYDSLLAPVRRFEAPPYAAPLHVVAAAWLGQPPAAAFAVVLSGPGAWHRSVLCVFGRDGGLQYTEIFDDDATVLYPRRDPTGTTVLLGGRNVVWQYRFPNGI